jgi:hypothetical protein
MHWDNSIWEGIGGENSKVGWMDKVVGLGFVFSKVGVGWVRWHGCEGVYFPSKKMFSKVGLGWLRSWGGLGWEGLSLPFKWDCLITRVGRA